jgi:hypothetical protein
MAYQDIDALTRDELFTGRVRACCTEQALVFRNDTRPEMSALADDLLRANSPALLTFVAIVAAAPGLAERAAVEGGVDQTLISDADILASVQGAWPIVADLLYSGPPATAQAT